MKEAGGRWGRGRYRRKRDKGGEVGGMKEAGKRWRDEGGGGGRRVDNEGEVRG